MIKTLQIGLDWLPERAGGLPRYYHELWRASGEVFDFSGMVVGTERVREQTNGAIVNFACPKANLATKHMGARRSFKALRSRNDTSLVASHFALSTFPVLSQIDTPIVVHFHGPWSREGRTSGQNRLQAGLKFHVEKRVYGRASRAIALSNAFADILEKDYGFQRSRIDVIPGGVDFLRFNSDASRREARATLGWRQDHFTIACIRRLVPRMGHAKLIAAAEILKTNARQVDIKLVGSGPLNAEINEAIKSKGLETHVQLIGHVPDEQLPLVYRAADLTIVPSTALEGFGLVVLESLAAGTPVVVTEVGGLSELMMPIAPQLIVPSCNPNDLADVIELAMLGGHVPSAAECQAYAARFDWPIIARRIRDVYERAL
jgi:glycogen(starch) synthase